MPRTSTKLRSPDPGAIGNVEAIGEVGFACVSLELGWSTNRTLRLANLCEERLLEKVEQNLDDLESLLAWMQSHELRLFRIGSSLVPLASHPRMNCDWQSRIADRLARIGKRAQAAGFRLSMHPGQYTVLNSPSEEVVRQSIAELRYSCQVLDLMGLDPSHKVLIHAGGVYGDKAVSSERLVRVIGELPEEIRRRLALENDERHFNFAEIVAIAEVTGVAPIFDLHHERLNPSHDCQVWLRRSRSLWDGRPKVHLSSQKPDARPGAHDERILRADLVELCDVLPFQSDLMIEAKGKEVAALEVLRWLGRASVDGTRA